MLGCALFEDRLLFHKVPASSGCSDLIEDWVREKRAKTNIVSDTYKCRKGTANLNTTRSILETVNPLLSERETFCLINGRKDCCSPGWTGFLTVSRSLDLNQEVMWFTHLLNGCGFLHTSHLLIRRLLSNLKNHKLGRKKMVSKVSVVLCIFFSAVVLISPDVAAARDLAETSSHASVRRLLQSGYGGFDPNRGTYPPCTYSCCSYYGNTCTCCSSAKEARERLTKTEPNT